jgi:hypothetical protein
MPAITLLITTIAKISLSRCGEIQEESGIAYHGVLLSSVMSYFMDWKSLGPQDKTGWPTPDFLPW